MTIHVVAPNGFRGRLEVETLRELDELVAMQKARGMEVDLKPAGDDLTLIVSLEAPRA